MNIFKELSVFNKITFVEKTHTYFIDNVQSHGFSVTGLIKRVKPVFDVESVSLKVARKNGVSQESIKEEWELKNKLSTTLGSIVHKYIENFYANKKIAVDQSLVSSILKTEQKIQLLERLPVLVQYFQQFYSDYSDLICARTELVVGDLDDTRICGMVDLLCYNCATDSYEIVDFKTNKNINTKAKYKTKLKAPFDLMPDCELTHYTIQLNAYKYIIEKYTSIKISGLKIVWLNVNNDTYKVFELEDIQQEITEVFESISAEVKMLQ